MVFKGIETENGDIILKAQKPLTWWQRLMARLALWAARTAWAVGWFGLGVLVGMLLQ